MHEPTLGLCITVPPFQSQRTLRIPLRPFEGGHVNLANLIISAFEGEFEGMMIDQCAIWHLYKTRKVRPITGQYLSIFRRRPKRDRTGSFRLRYSFPFLESHPRCSP